jgi:hypothetical protein
MPDDPFAHDSFLIEQKLAPVANLYRVYPSAPDGTRTGDLIAFARQKRMALKEQVTFFSDEKEQQEVMRIHARKRIDIGGRYDVLAPDGATLGVLERRTRKSFIKTQWALLQGDDEHEVAWAQERNLGIALARRAKTVLLLVPYAEMVAIAIPIPYHFVLRSGDREIGGLQRIYGFKDRYVLDLSGDPERTIDRRAAVAFGCALDALQSR